MKADSSTMQHKRESRSTFMSPLLTAFAVAQLVVVGFTLVHGAPSSEEACIGARFNFNQTYTPFSADSFFTPTLAFGSFSFSTAKTIDIIWDLFIGRGGQAVLMYIAYRVFTRSLVFSMESRPTPYQVFAAIAFDTVSMNTIHILGKECVAPWQRTRRRRLTIVGLIFASSYILAFPTLISALTGYDATWGDARKNSHLARQGYTIATYRAVIDLSKAIRHEIGEDCDVLSEKDLQSRLHHSGNGMLFQRAGVDNLDVGIELNQLLPDNEANKSANQSTNTSLYDGRWM
ncbi:hypothetical protein H2201_008344 [Coniosporium apollinis]|uniref:Integral membrane protein n=1 Tax=Coniosporium apollinis TaxID=61459 RepID=A0ABQ9NN18_9PEZI|nr:hypothetical protein H2201_008344 [Coniosporium apollinis]